MAEKRKDSKGRVLKTGESERKDGSYQYRFTKNGKRHTVYASTLKQLREKEEEVQKANILHIQYARGNMTVKELLEWYMSTKSNLCQGSIGTYTTDLHRIEKHSDLMDIKIKDVTTADIRELCKKLLKAGYATATIQRTRNDLMYPAFKLACSDGIIYKNPCDFHWDLPEKNRRKSLSKIQQKQLLSLVKNSPKFSPQYEWIYILLNTGLRIGELLGLTMRDIDMQNRIIKIDHQLQSLSYDGYVHCIKKPKTQSGMRIVPMTSGVYENFCRVIDSRPTNSRELTIDGYNDFLFFTRNDTIRTYATVAYLMKQIQEEYNRQYTNDPIRLTAHILRHTFCTNLVQSGASLNTIQYVMGHKHISTSLDIYTDSHFTDVSEEIVANIQQFGLKPDNAATPLPVYTNFYTK